MVINIKLYGGLVCRNRSLESFGMKKFTLDMDEAYSLKDIHRLLLLEPAGKLVNLVNGRAQLQDYVIDRDCSISIFPPMGERRYNPFEKIQ